MLLRQNQWQGLWLYDDGLLRLFRAGQQSYTGQVRYGRLVFARWLILGLQVKSEAPRRLYVDLRQLPVEQSRRLRAWLNILDPEPARGDI